MSMILSFPMARFYLAQMQGDRRRERGDCWAGNREKCRWKTILRELFPMSTAVVIIELNLLRVWKADTRSHPCFCKVVEYK